MTISSDTSTKTIGIHVRSVPVEAAEILADDAKTVNRSRESHIRAILIDYARRVAAKRQKEAAK